MENISNVLTVKEVADILRCSKSHVQNAMLGKAQGLPKLTHIRLEARVSERIRIAWDLHDTLLQSFQGLLLKLDAVTYLIRSRPAEAKEGLDGVIEKAQAAVVEARETVVGHKCVAEKNQ